MSKREQAIERSLKQAALDEKHDKKAANAARDMTDKLKRAAIHPQQIDSELESDDESDQSYDDQSAQDDEYSDEGGSDNDSDDQESEELPPSKKKKH
jgi:hypothetical protein